MKRGAPDAAPIVKPEPQEAVQDALEKANATDMETQREMEQAPAPAPVKRKRPSMRGRTPAEIAAQREETERRFGISLATTGQMLPHGRLIAPQGIRPLAPAHAPAPAPAHTPAPAPAPARVLIPDPPAHLTATGTAPPIPARPKFPNHRALNRVSDAFLLPYTHPLTKNEVLVVHRSPQIQTALKKFGMSVREVLEAMDLVCHQAYEIVHVGGNAMTYWTDNIKAEVEDRRMAPADTVSGLVAQWLTFATTHALFSGLGHNGPWGANKANQVIDPVAHHLYRAERKQQDEASAKARKKIDAWEAKHGDAVRKAEALHAPWIAYAQERANAVAQLEMQDCSNLVGAPHAYVYAEVAKALADETSADPAIESIKETVDRTTSSMEKRSRLVYAERKRFVAESNDVPPYQVQLLLRNARTAMDEHSRWLRKEIARAKAERRALELKSRARKHQKQRVVWELATLSVQRRNIRRAAEGAIAYALNELGRKHGCLSFSPLPDWVPGPWHKSVDERIDAADAVRADLFKRCAAFDAMLEHASAIVDKLEQELVGLERAVAKLPPLEPERGADSDDDDVAVCTGVVTREERDARGWQQAEVLE